MAIATFHELWRHVKRKGSKEMAAAENKKTRREFIADGIRTGGLIIASGAIGALAASSHAEDTVWQIDPYKCTNCGLCATSCVLDQSTVKCMHAFAMCGYCNLCSGMLRPERVGNTIEAENVQCPTFAIQRSYVENPYFQYVIDENLCIGCAKCSKGCDAFGNGSLFMQIRHDRCLNCNQCSIAEVCPAQAIARVPAGKPYLLKSKIKQDG